MVLIGDIKEKEENYANAINQQSHVLYLKHDFNISKLDTALEDQTWDLI